MRGNLEKWKKAVYWFSLIFLCTGVVVVSFGSWATLTNPLNDLISILPVSFIVMGVFIFLVSFMGWYASKRENKNLLRVYIGLLVLSICIIFGLAIGTYQQDSKMVESRLEIAWSNEYNADPTSDILYSIELEYFCCGFKNGTDMAVPENCMELFEDREGYPPTDGCDDDLAAKSLEYLKNVQIVGIVASCVMLFGLIFASLATYEAPTQEDKDRLLSEETKRLNEKWMPSFAGSTNTSYQQS